MESVDALLRHRDTYVANKQASSQWGDQHKLALQQHDLATKNYEFTRQQAAQAQGVEKEKLQLAHEESKSKLAEAQARIKALEQSTPAEVARNQAETAKTLAEADLAERFRDTPVTAAAMKAGVANPDQLRLLAAEEKLGKSMPHVVSMLGQEDVDPLRVFSEFKRNASIRGPEGDALRDALLGRLGPEKSSEAMHPLSEDGYYLPPSLAPFKPFGGFNWYKPKWSPWYDSNRDELADFLPAQSPVSGTSETAVDATGGPPERSCTERPVGPSLRSCHSRQ